MKEATERELSYYRAQGGEVPVQKWLSRLRELAKAYWADWKKRET